MSKKSMPVSVLQYLLEGWTLSSYDLIKMHQLIWLLDHTLAEANDKGSSIRNVIGMGQEDAEHIEKDEINIEEETPSAFSYKIK